MIIHPDAVGMGERELSFQNERYNELYVEIQEPIGGMWSVNSSLFWLVN